MSSVVAKTRLGRAFAQDEVSDVTRTLNCLAGEEMRGEDSGESDTLLDVSYDWYLGSDWLDARGFFLMVERAEPALLRDRSAVRS